MNAVPRVLVADGTTTSGQSIAEMIKGEPWHVVSASDGGAAMKMVMGQTADLVLMDASLAGIDGFEVCRRLRRNPRHRLLPIVLIATANNVDSRVAAIEAGADDILTKPIERNELIARVRSLLRMKAMRDSLEDTRQVIFALARAAEAKDRFTLKHAERVARTASILAGRAGIAGERLEQVRTGALVHDVGKIAVPDEILNKPGPLTASEAEIIKRHPVVGADIVASLAAQPDLIAIVRNHHERYDGGGYPDGLAADEIPLAARIVAICDAYDAMVSRRPYRPAMPLKTAVETLRAGKDRQWDGKLVDLFITNIVENR